MVLRHEVRALERQLLFPTPREPDQLEQTNKGHIEEEKPTYHVRRQCPPTKGQVGMA